MARKKKTEDAPQTIKGNHLTVHADGTLEWDWNALLKEVQEATMLIPVTEAKVKRTRKKKAAE